MNKRVTLADVAAHAGVSRATASLVIRDAGNLSDSTRERVRSSMRALGYVYHRGAASLRASQTKTVGLILPDPAYAFMGEMAISLESALAERGLLLLTANAFEDPQRQDRLLRALVENRVDGLVVLPALGTDEAFADRLAATGIPTVVTIRAEAAHRTTYVGIDNVRGGELAGEHLLAHGCRQFVYLGGLVGLRPRQDRMTGLNAALARVPGARLIAHRTGPALGRWASDAAARLLAEGPIPDAIVCHNDPVAFGVYRALRDVAPDLVDRVRVVAFDDVDEAALWEPPISSVAANGREVGRRTATALLRLMDDPLAEPEVVLLQPELVVRRSCGCPAA
nr:LacI family DNA-binding transcriptional regulator [Dactylosporangium thailandense]